MEEIVLAAGFLDTQLFVPDPFDFFEPDPYGWLEYQGHMVIGTLWFFSALTAFFARKGGKLHRWAGATCIISVLLVAISAIAMLAVEFVPPLALNAVTAPYAVVTAWLALQKPTRRVRTAEIGLTGVEVVFFMLFLAVALPNVFAGNIPPVGPLVVAMVPIILIAGDINFHLRKSERAKLRVRRHLARMAWGFAIVLRAPLIEFETAGYFHLPDPLLVIGPVLIGLALLLWFNNRYAPPKRPVPAATA